MNARHRLYKKDQVWLVSMYAGMFTYDFSSLSAATKFFSTVKNLAPEDLQSIQKSVTEAMKYPHVPSMEGTGGNGHG